MQNWYSQNKPFKSRGVAVGITVGSGAGVRVAIDARVVATASSIGMPGVADAREGNEQDVIKNPEINIIRGCHKILLTVHLNFNLEIPPKS